MDVANGENTVADVVERLSPSLLSRGCGSRVGTSTTKRTACRAGPARMPTRSGISPGENGNHGYLDYSPKSGSPQYDTIKPRGSQSVASHLPGRAKAEAIPRLWQGALALSFTTTGRAGERMNRQSGCNPFSDTRRQRLTRDAEFL